MKSRVSKLAFMFLMMFSLSTVSAWVVPVLSASTIEGDISKQEFAPEEVNKYDEYITLEGTEYLLKDSAYKELSAGEISRLEVQLSKSNKAFYGNEYKEEDGHVSASFKDARGYGVTRINVYWWGIKVRLSKGVFSTIVGMSIASATTYLMTKFSLGAAAAAAVAAGTYLAHAVVGKIRHGVYFNVAWNGTIWKVGKQ